MIIKKGISKQIPLKIFLSVALSFVFLTTTNGQTNKTTDKLDDIPISPTSACEEWISRITGAFIEWDKNKKGSIIVIARLGDGENARRLNLKRIKTLKEYIHGAKLTANLVFAEGEQVKEGIGVIELYIEGELFDTIGISTKSDIPLRHCNP